MDASEKEAIFRAFLLIHGTRGKVFDARIFRSLFSLLYTRALIGTLGQCFKMVEAGDSVDVLWTRKGQTFRMSLKSQKDLLSRMGKKGPVTATIIIHNTQGARQKARDYEYLFAIGVDPAHGLDFAIIPKETIEANPIRTDGKIGYKFRKEHAIDYHMVTAREWGERWRNTIVRPREGVEDNPDQNLCEYSDRENTKAFAEMLDEMLARTAKWNNCPFTVKG